ncbi:MAG TPA: ribonuclease E/G, partial [Alphaproteobacteria bacterium]|nr:ribonuclease E/G [Alphaproteobacteria bacterium]
MAATLDELLIEATPRRVRAAAIVAGKLVDFHAAPRLRAGASGSIYLGRITRRAAAMGAAFIDIGLDRPALLEVTGAPPADGAAVFVQVIEEASGDKGARVARRVALPGRFVVLLPGGRGVAVSKRFAGADGRALRDAAKRAIGPGLGAIIRERAAGVTPDAIEDELTALAARWAEIAARRASAPAPSCLVDTGDGLAEALDEFAPSDPRRIVANDRAAARALVALAEERYPELAQRIEPAQEGEALFDRHDVAGMLAAAEDKFVALPSGGRI